VNFNAGASSDADAIDSIASYTFNFGDGGDDVTQASPTISHTFADAGQYIVRGVVTDSRGVQSSNTARVIVNVDPPVTGIVSRKTHGIAGAFDVPLPITGNAGIECRSGGANNDYSMVFSFAHNLTSVTGASVTGGTGSVVGTSAIGPNPNQYTVNLTGVTNAQTITVGLNGIHDSTGATFGATGRMSVLNGDTTGDGVVNSTDIAQTKSQSGQNVGASNFRQDVTADGNLNSTDIAIVKSKSGTGLP
jgi:PKD repeat protein